MNAVSIRPITLSNTERDLVLELLEREHHNLPIEIHHTRTAKFREYLRTRLGLVDAVLNMLLPVTEASAAPTHTDR